MSIKNDKLFPLYVAYLERKKLSKGALTLAKMSEQFFSEFKKEYEESPGFKDKQDLLYKNVLRDIKLNDILDNSTIDDIDQFLNDL